MTRDVAIWRLLDVLTQRIQALDLWARERPDWWGWAIKPRED
jgi:hypothetical protein